MNHADAVIRALRRGLPAWYPALAARAANDTDAELVSVVQDVERCARHRSRLARALDGAVAVVERARVRLDPYTPALPGFHLSRRAGPDGRLVSDRYQVRTIDWQEDDAEAVADWFLQAELEGARVAWQSVVTLVGGRLVPTSSRWLRTAWRWRPERQKERLNVCSRAAGVALCSDGSAHAVSYGCGSRCCPVCERSKAYRRRDRYEAALEHARLSGWSSRFVTLTQPVDVELDEGLDAAASDLDRAWSRLRRDRVMRPYWRAMGAGLVATEATAKDRRGRRRWHVHRHVLITGPSGSALDELARAIQWHWWTLVSARQDPDADQEGRRRSKPSPIGGVDVQVVEGPDRLAEVMKYPAKLAEMSAPQAAEWSAWCVGRRLHLPLGALHQSSAVQRDYRAAEAAGTLCDGPGDHDPVAWGMVAMLPGHDHTEEDDDTSSSVMLERHHPATEGHPASWVPLSVRDLAEHVQGPGCIPGSDRGWLLVRPMDRSRTLPSDLDQSPADPAAWLWDVHAGFNQVATRCVRPGGQPIVAVLEHDPDKLDSQLPKYSTSNGLISVDPSTSGPLVLAT